jgi:hypothetical protein
VIAVLTRPLTPRLSSSLGKFGAAGTVEQVVAFSDPLIIGPAAL